MFKKAFAINLKSNKFSKNVRRKKALIVYGGWEGHKPRETSEIIAGLLREENFDVEVSNTLDSFLDQLKLKHLDLIVPLWTNGTITDQQLKNLLAAVESGTGLAGLHQMADAFRCEIEYQLMVGGQFMVHPGGNEVTYQVEFKNKHQITKGIEDFIVTTEKWYMLLDPANNVLATTNFDNVAMPVVWTKNYGKGKVFYTSLGHSPEIVKIPQVLTMMKRGMLWASNCKTF